MPFMNVNSVNLYYETAGDGRPVVLVHGSWGDHHNWAPVVPLLSQSFRVVTFDRRGHSQSEAGRNQGSFAEDADDLGELIERLGLAPAHVVGNSGGAAIALRLASSPAIRGDGGVWTWRLGDPPPGDSRYVHP